MKTIGSFTTTREKASITEKNGTNIFQKQANHFIFHALVLFLLLISWEGTMAADRYSVASGVWSSTATWSDAPGGASGFSVPAADDNVYIQGGFTVTLDQNTANLALLSIASGSTFTTSSTYTVSAASIIIDGLYVNGSSGSITATSGIIVNGTFNHAMDGGNLPTATWAVGSTCLVTDWTGTATLNSSFNQTFYNFAWNCPNQSANVSFAGYVATVTGTFTLISTGPLGSGSIPLYVISPGGDPTYGNYSSSGGSYNVTYGGVARTVSVTNDFSLNGGHFYQSRYALSTLTVGGNYTISDGSHIIARTAGASATVGGDFLMTGGYFRIAYDEPGSLTVMGDFSVTGPGTVNMSDANVTGTLYVAGDFTYTAGWITETGTGSGAIIFNGTETQTFTSSRTLSDTFNFTVNNGATLQMASESTVISGGGTFTLSAGGTLGITSANGITADPAVATGNIRTTTARVFSEGAKYIYNGTTAQVTGTGLTQNIPADLDINNSAGVTLSTETTISGILTLSNGNLLTGSNTLILNNTSVNAVSGGSASSYVNGTLRRNIAAGANTYVYPIGTSSAYAPVSLTFGDVTATGYLNGSTTDGDHANIGSSYFVTEETVNRTWSFSVSGGLGILTCGATFNWVAGDQDPGFIYSNAIVGEYSGSWNYPPVSTRNATSIQVSGLTGFGDFQVGNSSVISEPTIQATGVVFSNITPTGMTISWTNGDGARRIVLVKSGSAVNGAPDDATSYSASTVFGSGQQIGDGNYVVYNSTGNSVDITGLSRGISYYVAVYEFNGSGGLEDYLIEDPATGYEITGSSGDYRSAGSGDWGTPATWEYFNGSWAPAIATPTSADGQITILNGHIVTAGANVTVDQVVINFGGQATVSSGTTLTIANGPDVDFIVNGILDNTGTLTTTGSLAVNDGGRYIHSTSGLSLPTATWNTGSTCDVTGYISGSLSTGWAGPFYNFTWNCPGQGANVSFGNRVTTVNGTFTLANTNGNSIRPAWSPTYGNYIQTGGIYTVTIDLTPRVVNVLNDFVVSGGTFNMSSSLRSGSLEVAGNVSIIENGTLTETGSSYGIISFTGSTVQIYTSGGSLTEEIDIQVNEGAILQMADQNTTVFSDGLFYLSTGATLGITSPDGITSEGTSLGNIQTAARTFEPGANYVYNGTVNQNTGSGLPSNLEGKLNINNTGLPGSNTVTLDAGRTIEAGGSVEIVNGTFNSGDNLTMATTSTITRSGGSMTGTPQGTGIYNVNYTGNSMTTTSEISGSGLNNITASLTSGQTLTLSQDIVPDGDLTLTSGILDLGEYTGDRSAAGGTLTVADNATLKTGGTNALPANYTYSLGATSTVEYSGETQIITTATYGNLALSGTGRKTINAGDRVTVAADLTTSDLLTIESAGATSSGSLIVNGTSTGNVTYKRVLREGDDFGDKHLFSSPVGGQSVSVFISDYDLKIDSLRIWDEVNAIWSLVTTGDFISGLGYNVYQADISDGEFSFTGPVINSGSVIATSPYAESFETRIARYPGNPYGDADPDQIIWATPRSWTNWGGGGWNLLGNPFTSAMDAAEFISDNTLSFDPYYQALYVYDGVNSVYKYAAASVPGYPEGTESHGSVVQAGQGFMIMANNNNVQFDFTSSMQTHSTDVIMLKSAEAEDPWPGLQLKVKYGDKESHTTIVYNDAMTAGLDPGYDVGQLSSGPAVEVYTVMAEKDDGVNLARQALPVYGADTIIIPVGIDTEKGGGITFSAYTISLGNNKFWLEDRNTGIFTDLTTKSYTVMVPANTYGTGRFFIVASANTPTGIEKPQISDTGVRIWASDGRLIVKGQVSGQARCEVYDVNGQKIIDIRLMDSELNTVDLPESSKGVLIVRVIDGVKMTTRKVAIL